MTNLLKDFFLFLFSSKKKKDYFDIAKNHQTNPFKVYRLAHGKKAGSEKDFLILENLHKRRIIGGVEIKYV